MFLYDFATKTAQKPDTVATYIRRNEKIFKNHVERREKQLWLDEKAVKILLILVHIVYVLIRWYVKGCKRSRGYY